MKIIIKQVPANEIGNGTEIALLKKYFDDMLLDDPKDLKGADDNEGIKSYPINATYKNNSYLYLIKAYKTQDYSKDRRLILNSNTDPLSTDRKTGDFLCLIFKDKITINSRVEIKIITKKDNIYSVIESQYKISNGLVIDIFKDPVLYKLIENLNSKNPLNQIIFGPPGTGKTYSTIDKALGILNELSLYTDENKHIEKNREIFRSLLNKKIFFVTMHPSYSYEDFVQGIKPKTSNKGELLFELKDGIFKRIAELCLPYLFSYYFPGFLMSIYEKELKEIIDPAMNQQQLLDFIGRKCNVSGGTIKNTRDYFDNVLGSLSPRVGFSDEQFVANNIDKEFYLKLSKSYLRIPKDMLLNSFRNNWVNSSVVSTSQDIKESKYVLILDEINRANISKVFGELITLLEEDKRIGKENEISVILPSGEIFSVPPNLYIIGTMNTADKSIALVDIALRRRFQFIPVYPDSTIILKYCKSTDKDAKALFMDKLNTILRAEKGVDFQIGHAYFLKDNTMADVINENVIPLLTEYFRNDLDKVKSLLKECSIIIDEEHYQKTGLLQYSL